MTDRARQAIRPELLAEVFATFVPMDRAAATRRAAVAIETLGATRSLSDLIGLRIALEALEVGPLRRFTRGTQDRRERALLGWATSPIPQQRTTFQALKRLALFLAYADPEEHSSAPMNDSWAPIGYLPPARVTDPPAPLVRPLDVSRTDSSPLTFDAEVVIVGSGAGGSVVAARLAEAGRDVLVLEAGGYRPEAEMPISEAQAWRDMLLDRGAASTQDLSVTILAGATLGGGTTVNWTTTIRPPDWLRDEWETDHGLIGFASAETDADLARLEDELEVMPPTVVPPKDQLILDGARALGWEADVTQRSAGPCTRCGGCTFGCQLGAKRSALRVHLARAGAAGARILTEARATALRHRAGDAVGVVGRLEPDGRPFAVRARQTVVAAGALRTPVLLERSRIDHPAIGRGLRLHPSVVIAARMAERAEMWVGPLQAARSLEFVRPGGSDGSVHAHGGFIIEAAPPHPGLAMAALPWAGREEAARLAGTLGNLAPLIALVRDQGGGRVRAGTGGRARVSYRLDPRDGSTARRALIEMSRLARAGGAAELLAVATPGRWWRDGDDFERYLEALSHLDTGANRITVFSAHQMGTARAGKDPRTSATDPWGRVRRSQRGEMLRGAYVADASLFPSASGVNPMLTIMACAERVARAVLDDRGS